MRVLTSLTPKESKTSYGAGLLNISMPQNHKTSFLITLTLLFLLPIFFIPGGVLYLNNAKSVLLVFGVIAATLMFLLEIWQRGELDVPWHPFILVVVLLPLAYLISALLSTPSSLSLLGYSFETGTFGYMLFGSILLVLVGITFTGTSRVLQALAAFLISVSIVAVFVAVKIVFSGDFLAWGSFFGNMGNPIGSWTDLAVSFGLLSSFAALVLGMIPMKISLRVLVGGIFIISTALLIIINFSPAFILTLGTSVVLLLYFGKIEKDFLYSKGERGEKGETSVFARPTFLPIVLGVISLIFLINPAISETRGTLGNVVANTFGINNTDVRPSFSATLNISKAVLSQGAFLGSGPNTFSYDWLIYKPVNVNITPFWAVAFPFGISFIPTQIASTGIAGTTLWLAFFTLLFFLGIGALSHIPESRAERFTLISVFLLAFFLWASSFLYAPSGVVLMLAFIFSGLLVAVSRTADVISFRTFNLRESAQARFVSILLIAATTLGALSLGWVGFGKTASAFYFKRAVDLSNIAGTPLEKIENELNRAVKFSPEDIYYVAVSRVNFSKAQMAANNTAGIPKENQAIFEEAVRKSIEAARSAVSINPAGFENWVLLGQIFSSLVPAPLSVEGAYENAQFAYNEAFKRNPTNPELPLLLSRLELNKGNTEDARSFIRNSIALKEDYADAYLMLAQLEIQQNNIPGAIASAQKLSLLMPNNSGVYFELGVLKYSNKDYTGATDAFNRALIITPDHANAKYYLGLALSRLGRLEEALTHFEALSVSNPESKEVQLILKDLRAGKDSFLDTLTK
ncbi:MAG: tetratricopeptide repeat protein [bacterium]|nr:tetratricopeptide repeat protein [bacterium]